MKGITKKLTITIVLLFGVGILLWPKEKVTEGDKGSRSILHTAGKTIEVSIPRTDFSGAETPSFNISVKPDISPTGAISLVKTAVASVFGNSSDEIKADVVNVDGEVVKQLNIEYGILNIDDIAPGKYTLKIYDSAGTSIMQDFSWGVLAINPNKSIYKTGETAKLAMAVLDERGEMTCNAGLKLEIRNSKNETNSNDKNYNDSNSLNTKHRTLSTSDGSIKVNEEVCRSKEYTLTPDYESEYKFDQAGTYDLELTAITENGSYTIIDEITVVDDNFQFPNSNSQTNSNEQISNDQTYFDVERITATRIFPLNNYPVVIAVTPENDFSGTVEEKVPSSFIPTYIHENDLKKDWGLDYLLNRGVSEIYQPTIESDNWKLKWDVNWKAGETYYIAYQYDSPDESPEFYTLGPLEFKSQITNNNSQTGSNEQFPNEEINSLTSDNPQLTTVWTESRVWQIAVDATAGPNNPGTSSTNSTVGTSNWSGTGTPGNVASNNTIYATASGSGAYQSYYLTATNFGFSIPAGTVNGITVEVDRKFTTDGNDSCADASIKIIKGGILSGTDQSAGAAWPTSDAYATYGGTSSLWGTTWSSSDINDVNFGVAISGGCSKSGGPDTNTLSIDHIRITITHTPTSISVGGTSNGTGTVAVAFDGTIQTGFTSAISGGTWSIAGLTPPASGTNIITFIDDGVGTTANDSSAIMTYSGSGNVGGMVLDPHTLSIGADEDSSTTVTALINDYDHDNDPDIIFSANGTTVDATASAFGDEKFTVLSGDTFSTQTVSSNVLTTHDVEINGTLIAAGSTSINVSGSWDNNSDFQRNTSTVTFNGSGSETLDNTGASTHQFYILTTSGTVSLSLTTTSSILNNLNIGSGTTVQNNGTLTVTGDIAVTGKLTIASTLAVNGGGLTTSGTGVSGVSINYSGTPTATIAGAGTLGGGTGTITFYSLVTNGASQTTTVSTNNVAIDNNLTVGSTHTLAFGTNSFAVGSSSVTNSGGIDISGVISQSASATTTVVSSSGGAATIGGTGCTSTNCTFYNLSFLPTVASAPTFTLGSASGQTIRVTGTLTVGNGTNPVNVTANSNNPTIYVTGAMTVAANGGAYVSASSSLLSVGGVFTNNGTFSGTGSLDFDGNLINNGTFTGPTTSSFNVSGDWSNSGSFTVTGAYYLRVQGDWSNSGSFTANQSTITLYGSGGTNNITSGGGSFYNLEIDSSFGGDSTNQYNLQDALDVDGNLFIYVKDTLSTSTHAVNVAGDWTNNGTYTASNTTTLDGASGTTQTVAGSTTFSTLSVTNTATRTLAVTAGTTQTISTGITLGGSASCNNLLLVRSTSKGTSFTIANSDASPTVTYVDFQDTSVNTNQFSGTGLIDSGNNEGGNADITFDNACEGGSTSELGTQYSFQRKTFKDEANSIHWLAYHDGDEIEFKASDDNGATWTRETQLAYDTNDFSLFDKTISATASAVLAVASSNDIVVRRGDLAATPAVTWQAEVVAMDGTGASDTYDRPFVSLDSNNFIWVGARYYDGTNYVYKAVKSTEPVQSLWSGMAFGTASQLSDDQTDANVYGNIVPLASEDMYATFVSATALEGCVWDQSDSAWENSDGSASCTPVAAVGGGDTEADLTTNLVGYWKMDETSGTRADSSGNGNTLTDNNTVTSNPGKLHTAGQFTATNLEYLSHTDNTFLSTGNIDFTISAWIYLDDDTTTKYIATKESSSSDTFEYQFSVSSVERLRFSWSDGGTGYDVVESDAGLFTTGVWYHVTAYHDEANDEIGVAINGEVVKTAATSGTGNDSTADFRIGRYRAGDYWNGRIDEVRIYKRLLTYEEIAQLSRYVPEPVNIDDASDFGPLPGAGRQVVRTKSGTLYSFVGDGLNCEMWKSSDGMNWNNVATLSCDSATPVAAAIDNSDNIHVVYSDWSDNSLNWNKLTTSTDTFGTAEDIMPTQILQTYPAVDVAVDSSGEPHFVFKYNNTDLPIYQIRYRNRVGGSMQTARIIETNSSNIFADFVSISLNRSGYPVVGYINSTDDDLTLALGNGTNPTAFTNYDADTDINDNTNQKGLSIGIDTLSGYTWVSYVDDTNGDDTTTNDAIALLKYTGSDTSSSAWTTSGNWTAVTSKTDVGYEPSIAIAENSQIYVFYQDDETNQRISYDVYDSINAEWAGETPLQTPSSGNFSDVKAKWSFEWNNYGANRIDYLFSDGTDVYWDYLYVRRSPTNIDDASDLDIESSAGRQVVRTSSGDLYAVVDDAGVTEVWKSADNGNSWSQQDSADSPASHTTANRMAVAIDSSDKLHILYTIDTNGVTPPPDNDLRYITFTTTDNQFGSIEDVNTTTSVYSGVAIALDSNDKPHIVVAGYDGNVDGGIEYNNKVDGTWIGTAVEIEDIDSLISSVDITISDENIPEVVYIEPVGNDLTAAIGDDNDPDTAVQWTKHDVDTDVVDTGDTANVSTVSIGNDSSGNTWIAYVDEDGTDDYITLAKHTDGTAWADDANWTIDSETASLSSGNVGLEPSMIIDGTNIYVLYEDDQDDIVYDMYNGTSWSGETLIEEHGALQDVKARWSYINNYDSTGTARVQTNTYYFDASDGGPTDQAGDPGAWTNDTNAFDGITSTSANTSSAGSTSSNYLQGDGTNSPITGGTIVSVKMRVYASSPFGTSTTAVVYTDGLGESLGLAGFGNGTGWGNYVSLSTPSGGWSWTVINNLETKIYCSDSTSCSIYRVEILVESTNTDSQTEIDYVYSDGTDVFYNRVALGAASTPGTQDDIDSTVSSGATKTISTVSDSTNYDVFLEYIDSDGSLAFKRWDNNGASSAWQTTVALDATTTDAYPSLSIDTSTRDLYAFYIDTSSGTINYKKCTMDATECAADDWATETSWKTGTNSYVTSSFGESGEAFAEWSVGTTQISIDWDRITGVAAITFTQNDFEWFVTADSVTLTNAWPPGGGTDLIENAEFTQIPATNLPLVPYDGVDATRSRIRIQMNFTVGSANLSATSQKFQLQYASTTTGDCTTATGWTAVGDKASGSIWRLYDESSIGDSTTQVNDVSTSTTGAEGYYSEINPSATNPNAVNIGQNSEWDWPVENNGAAENTTYCFRMVKHDGVSTATPFSAYNADGYPKLSTAPGTSVLMRHGNFYINGSEQGFYWAN